MDVDINVIRFDEQGLVPAIIQDAVSGKVLMLAYMNRESLQKTIETRKTWFFSRSRNQLWNKGETSGNFQRVKKMSYDCDGDSLLVEVEQTGPACHTGEKSCFYRELFKERDSLPINHDIIYDLYERIVKRKQNPMEGSYTNYLFREGIDKILKKIGEETSEVIIGAKNNNKEELIYELSDLIYHSLVLMVQQNIKIEDLKQELTRREKN